MVELLDFSIEYPGEKDLKRQAYRLHVPGLSIRIQGQEASCPVIDLSPLGLAFKHEGRAFSLGQTFTLDLYARDKLWVDGLNAKIVRVREKSQVACVFVGLTRVQERALDTLTLEIQKRLIDLRKKKQQQEGNETRPHKT